MTTANASFLMLLILNSLISLIIAMLLVALVPKRMQRDKLLITASFWATSSFIPLFGPCLILVILTYLNLSQTRPEKKSFSEFVTPKYLPKIKLQEKKFGEGGTTVYLGGEHFSTESRTEALLAIDAMGTPLSNLMIQETFQDKNDELRLFAFNLIDKKQKKLDTLLKQTLSLLNQPFSKREQAKIYRRLACIYWEMVYTGIVQGDYLNSIIHNTIRYAKKALEELQDDAMLWILLGRVYFEGESFQEAEKAFTRAKALQAPPSNWLPYLGDIAFRQGDYKRVKQLFHQHPLLQDIPKLDSLVQFWCPQ